jgi:hypothetical protein
MVLHGQLCGRVGRRRFFYIKSPNQINSDWGFFLCSFLSCFSTLPPEILSRLESEEDPPVPISEHGSYTQPAGISSGQICFVINSAAYHSMAPMALQGQLYMGEQVTVDFLYKKGPDQI